MSNERHLSDSLLHLVINEVIERGRCHLPGFGVWTLRVRPARRIRHPVSKELVTLPASPELRFRAAKRARLRLDAKLARETSREEPTP